MSEARYLPPAIQWHEGMLLAPQHFQQLSLRHEELLHYHLMLAVPFQWGVRKLEVDHTLLIDGRFSVQDLEAVMPDGLVVHHGLNESDRNTLELDLTSHVEELKQGALTIQLAVPAQKNGTNQDRFHPAEVTVADEYPPKSEISIPRLFPRVLLKLTDDPPSKYASFPLAKVRYENETFVMTDFVPPLLSVMRGSDIWKLCADVARKLREKADALSKKIITSHLETKLQIHALVSGLPHFEVILNTPGSHPYPLYLSLCSLVGKVSFLGEGMVPTNKELRYDHNDLFSTFKNAADFIVRMLKSLRESYSEIKFEFQDGIFGLELKEMWMTDELIIGAKRSKGLSEKDMTNWISNSLIGSVTKIEEMKMTRVSGADRSRIEGDEELGSVKDVTFFSLKKTDRDERGVFIEPNKELQISNPADPNRPDEIILYVRAKS